MKMSHLWLPLSVFCFVDSNHDIKIKFYASLIFYIAITCWGIVNILVNDMTDKKSDLAAGKKRWISEFPVFIGIVVNLLFIAAGFYCLSFFKYQQAIVFTTYLLAIMFGITYSLLPFRFKERGMLGLICYSFSCVIGYVLLSWSWFKIDISFLLLISLIVFFDKCTHLLFHQILDYSNDLKKNNKTYVVNTGLAGSQKFLVICSFFTSVLIIVFLIFFLFYGTISIKLKTIIISAFVISLAAAFLYSLLTKKQFRTSLLNELSWFYLGLTYFKFCVLPLIILISLALREKYFWYLTSLNIVSFLWVSLNSYKYKYD